MVCPTSPSRNDAPSSVGSIIGSPRASSAAAASASMIRTVAGLPRRAVSHGVTTAATPSPAAAATTVSPSPAIPARSGPQSDRPRRMSSSITRVATPKPIRCAATAQNAATTPGAERAARPPSTRPWATALRVCVVLPSAAACGVPSGPTTSGPREPRANPSAMTTMISEPITDTAAASPDPASSAPITPVSANAQEAPTAAAIGPAGRDQRVGGDEPARGDEVRQRGGQTRLDEPADADGRQRAQVEARSGDPGRHDRGRRQREHDAQAPATTNTWRRSQRSSSAPANGPTSEYGSSTTASPSATSTGSDWRSGLNSTAPPSAAWKTPSPHCAPSRIASSRRKPGLRHELAPPDPRRVVGRRRSRFSGARVSCSGAGGGTGTTGHATRPFDGTDSGAWTGHRTSPSGRRRIGVTAGGPAPRRAGGVPRWDAWRRERETSPPNARPTPSRPGHVARRRSHPHR